MDSLLQLTLGLEFIRTKRCIGCRKYFGLSHFNKDKNRKSGLNQYCRDCSRLNVRRSYQKTGGRCNRDSCFKRRYGITLEQYEAMHEAQRGLCAICGKPETEIRRNNKVCLLSVDHDHRTGEVRKLLCCKCNQAVGSFKDSPDLCERAAVYLRKYGK
jgi:hypothetical protein